MNNNQDIIRLRHMLDAAQKIVSFLEGVNELAYKEDEKLQLAIIRLLEIVGEAANSISDQFKEDNVQIPWCEMTATRNRLIHGYFDVDLAIVWKIITEDIPQLIKHLSPLV